MDGKSMDTVATLKDKLSALIPEAFTEGKIDWEKLKATLGEDINFSNERYVLNWAGKSEAFKVMQAPSTKTLIPAKDESINFDETENIFIEGENLEVLKALQKSYFGKIKMIYIDPPYNTGNDSFIYPDKFSETKAEYQKRVGDKDEEGYMTKDGMFHKNSKENGQYHSNWLNMMYPRLFMAKNLLTEDGVIFVSIDDTEVHNLRLLMNEIFGEENFVSEIIWEKKYSPQNDAKFFSLNHEQILLFAKSKEKYNRILLPVTPEQRNRYRNPDGDERGDWKSGDLLVATYNEKYDFEITTPGGRKVTPPSGRCWRVSKEKFDALKSDNRLWFGDDGNNIPSIKRFYTETNQGMVPISIWKHQDVGHTQSASNDLKELFKGKKFFDYPKPVQLIKRCIQVVSKDDDIILDFFSGSGTLGQAVLDFNNIDGKNRKFICVQLPEPCEPKSEAYKAGFETIADISKERIRRVTQKIKEEQEGELDFEGCKQDLGFKVFKLSESNFKQWQPKPKSAEELEAQMKLFVNPINGEPTDESMAFELLLKSGLSLNSKIEEKEGFYLVNENELALVLSETTESVFKAIAEHNPKRVIALDIVFKDNDQLKTNAALQLKDAGIDFKTI